MAHVITSDDLKPVEVARALRCSLRTIRRYLADGRFPNAWQTPGGRWWIPKGDVAGWRDAQGSTGNGDKW